jgi:branched-chain amino acid transport system substrate-binding protein
LTAKAIRGDHRFQSHLTRSCRNPDVTSAQLLRGEADRHQARQLGIKSAFIGGDGWGGVSEYATAEDLEGSVYCSGYAPGSTEEIKAFEAAFTAKYPDEKPDMFSAQAYDAAIVLLDAIKAAESKGLKAGSDEYKTAVIDAMKNTASVGLSGKYAFDEFNNPVKSAAIMKVTGGQEVFTQMF